MKKKLIIGMLGCFPALLSYGQQYALHSQYMFNEAYFNPAVAGSKDYIPIHFNFRRQWAGFDGAPMSQTLTTHADLGSNFGLGGNFYNESSGPSRSTGANVMLSYRLRLTKDDVHSLRFGLGASFSQHVVDLNRLTTETSNDPAFARPYNYRLVLDADAGVYYSYKNNKGFAGFSVKNAAQSKKNLFEVDEMLYNTMTRHYYLMGGYNFTLADKWELRTSTLMRFIEAKPFQFDLNVLAQYNDLLWFGVGYRHLDAVSIMAGVQYKVIKVGYAYDAGISQIRKYSNGSHEVFVEFRIFRNKSGGGSSTPWAKRNRVYNQNEL